MLNYFDNLKIMFCVHSVSNTDVSCQKNRVVVPKQRTASIPLVLLTLIHSLIETIAGNKLEFEIRPMHTGKCDQLPV